MRSERPQSFKLRANILPFNCEPEIRCALRLFLLDLSNTGGEDHFGESLVQIDENDPPGYRDRGAVATPARKTGSIDFSATETHQNLRLIIAMAKKSKDEFRDEAERLAQLSPRDRKEALAVHWRIADDATLSDVTREHARLVAESLEKELARIKREKL